MLTLPNGIVTLSPYLHIYWSLITAKAFWKVSLFYNLLTLETFHCVCVKFSDLFIDIVLIRGLEMLWFSREYNLTDLKCYQELESKSSAFTNLLKIFIDMSVTPSPAEVIFSIRIGSFEFLLSISWVVFLFNRCTASGGELKASFKTSQDN
jgi:hypothetical protein